MTRADDNLISFTGDALGNIWRNGHLIFTPVHTRDECIWTERPIELPAGRRIADTLKFSGVRGLTVRVQGVVPGGYEDCVDINNHCSDVIIIAPDGFAPRGRYLATIKGGSRYIALRGAVLGHGRVVDVDLGNLTDQSDDITSGVVLELSPAIDGRPVTWRQLNATAPELLGNNVTYRRTFRLRGWFRPLFAKGGALLKRLGLPL